jgi:hypothetical protein
MFSKIILSKALRPSFVVFIFSVLLSATFSSPNLAMNDGGEDKWSPGSAKLFDADNTLEGIRKQVSAAINTPFVQEYMSELTDLHKSENKPVNPSIEYVFVLSARGSYLKDPVVGLDIKDLEDDYNRIELGIKIAQVVVGDRLEKSEVTQEDIEKHGPIIIYNGKSNQNEDLTQALENGILSHYPKDKFHIMAIKEESTRGQFKNLKEDFPISNASVAIITHAYHYPRVARMIGSQWHPFGENTKVHFYLVDRELKAPGILEDIQGEIVRIPQYIEKGDLNNHLLGSLH